MPSQIRKTQWRKRGSGNQGHLHGLAKYGIESKDLLKPELIARLPMIKSLCPNRAAGR
jgi:hypothetical protein